VIEHLECFLADCWRDKPHSRARRRQWFHSFAKFCDEVGVTLSQITPEIVNQYHERLLWAPGPRSISTIDQGLRELRTFLRWAVRQGHLRPDPTVGWLLPKPQTREKKLLTRAQLEAILDESPDNEPMGLRDRAILCVLAETGLSTTACQNLDLVDLDLAHYRLCRKPLSPRLAEHLQRYLRKSRPALMTDPDEPALFLNRVGARLLYHSVRHVVRRHAGVPLSPQLLRRSWLAHREAFLGRRLTDS
jgi:site-specific recombinase XerD